MKVEFYCPLWGRAEQPFEEFCQDAKNAGYDGVEMPFSLVDKERDSQIRILKDSGLKLISQHWETFEPDFEKHKTEYEMRLRNLVKTEPEFISSQTGRDWFSFEKNLELLALAASVAEESGVKITHETHRGKMMFAAHIARLFLEKLPALRLTLDISHWCNVAETLLHDQEDAVALALSRTDHIHARVGFPESPQVPDPAAPEWEEALNRHLGWWDEVIRQASEEGREILTITNEFGPYPYMIHTPYENKPIADQWQINIYMKDLLKKRYMG